MLNDFMKVFNIKTNVEMAEILKVDPSSVRRWRNREAKTPEYILVSIWAEWRIRHFVKDLKFYKEIHGHKSVDIDHVIEVLSEERE